MGTNYYLKGRPACEHCGRPADDGLHIGKSSHGWTFGLRIYPLGTQQGLWAEDELSRLGVDEIRSLEDWLPLFERFGVVDEYGDEVNDMKAIITERVHPRGELRRRYELAEVSGYHVTFPAGVTYDLVVGEFS